MESKNEIFIEKAKLKHSDSYDYSLVDYINNKTNVKIICQIHGEFEQIPNTHLSGSGCPRCGSIIKANKRKLDINTFINRAKEVHGDKYDYSLVKYVGDKIKVKIICPIHSEFEQTPHNHMNGSECTNCSYEKRSENKKSNTENFIIKAKKIHGDKYMYDKTVYEDVLKKIKIQCQKHGVFEQSPNGHLNGQGCPKCKESKGEKTIRELLIKNNIKFNPQHRFPECKDKKQLPFDFYLPKDNLCIEFNGKQHYEPITYFGGKKSFDKQIKRDLIKKQYCENNKINLIVIKYDDNIDIKLKGLLFT